MLKDASNKPQISFLLGLWGKTYITMFCDFSLSSLLTPGNIPALAKEYKCVFTMLTKKEDIPFFERQPLVIKLKQYCEMKYVDIHDIIYKNNYSATLTVALERGMRSFGEEMLNTYFIYLMGDYLFGNNALSGLLPHIRNNVSVITAGNYQVVEEEVLEDLRKRTDPDTGLIDMSSRDLVAWSLRHLNPITVGNMVNSESTHTLHCNRLFWRVDDDTMIGRFYLRHTLCLKPERMDYVIGSSWDYSFRSEMCPSDNVVHLSDSDDYFVVELQPLLHEGKLVALGPHKPKRLARSLMEWTTAEQRANAQHVVVYHAKNITPEAQRFIDESRAFVEQVDTLMTSPPIPIRGHFYWLDCVQWLTADAALLPGEYGEVLTDLRVNLWDSPVYGPPLRGAGLRIEHFPPMEERKSIATSKETLSQRRRMKWLYRVYGMLAGNPPYPYLWHPQFFDYRMLLQALGKKRKKKLLAVLPPQREHWLRWAQNKNIRLASPVISARRIEDLREDLKDTAAAIICLPPEYDAYVGMVFDTLAQAMPEGSDIHIFIKPHIFHLHYYQPRHIALRYAHLTQKPGVKMTGKRTSGGLVRGFFDDGLSSAATRLRKHYYSPLGIIFALEMILLHVCFAAHNAVRTLLHSLRMPRIGQRICCMVMSFRVQERAEDTPVVTDAALQARAA